MLGYRTASFRAHPGGLRDPHMRLPQSEVEWFVRERDASGTAEHARNGGIRLHGAGNARNRGVREYQPEDIVASRPVHSEAHARLRKVSGLRQAYAALGHVDIRLSRPNRRIISYCECDGFLKAQRARQPDRLGHLSRDNRG